MCDGHTPVRQTHPSLIMVETLVNGKPMNAMIDTGATISFISQAELEHMEHPPIQENQMTALLGDGQSRIHVKGSVDLTVTINDIDTVITVLVVECLGAKLILRMDWCIANNVTVNTSQKQVQINNVRHGTTTTPFLETCSIDVHLAESVTLYTTKPRTYSENVGASVPCRRRLIFSRFKELCESKRSAA